jgi:hypothetical protein
MEAQENKRGAAQVRAPFSRYRFSRLVCEAIRWRLRLLADRRVAPCVTPGRPPGAGLAGGLRSAPVSQNESGPPGTKRGGPVVVDVVYRLSPAPVAAPCLAISLIMPSR